MVCKFPINVTVPANELFEIRHQCVACMRIHQIARSLELGARQIRAILENSPDPLLVHRTASGRRAR